MKLTTEIQDFLQSWNSFNGNSMTIKNDGFRKLIGDFAEYGFQWSYPLAFRISQTDQQSDFIYKDQRVDVKAISYYTTDFTNCEVKVPAYQKDYNTDWYCFFFFSKIDQCLRLAGWIKKEDFFKQAIFRKKGDVVQPFNFKVLADCYTLHWSKLIKGTGQTSSP